MLRFACLALLVTLVVSLELKASLKGHWETFKSNNKKSYDSGEESKRKENFKNNVEKMLTHNLNADLGGSTHKLGINEYSDMSHEEFKKTMLGLKLDGSTRNVSNVATSSRGTPPATRDWSAYLTPVKNQGSCGSCWTFATTGAIEGHVAIYTGKRVSLSEQNLLDCSGRTYGNYGCDGGLPDNAMKYIKANRGIDSDSCYPYENRVGTCRYTTSCNSATISNYADVPYGDENALLEAVGNRGPVAIGIDAGQSDFQQYSGGVYYNSACSTRVNHAVLAVGYGTENGYPYWLVKNSWGTSWGAKGYFKLYRGVNACGCTTLASYPVL